MNPHLLLVGRLFLARAYQLQLAASIPLFLTSNSTTLSQISSTSTTPSSTITSRLRQPASALILLMTWSTSRNRCSQMNVSYQTGNTTASQQNPFHPPPLTLASCLHRTDQPPSFPAHPLPQVALKRSASAHLNHSVLHQTFTSPTMTLTSCALGDLIWMTIPFWLVHQVLTGSLLMMVRATNCQNGPEQQVRLHAHHSNILGRESPHQYPPPPNSTSARQLSAAMLSQSVPTPCWSGRLKVQSRAIRSLTLALHLSLWKL